MVRVEGQERMNLSKVFHDPSDSVIIACIQGVKGEYYVDSLKDTTVGVLCDGYFIYVDGSLNADTVSLVKEYLQDSMTLSCAEIIPQTNDWAKKIEQILKEIQMFHVVPKKRFRMELRDGLGQINQLNHEREVMSKEYQLFEINQQIYEQSKQDERMNTLCIGYPTWEQYEKRGFGFVIMKEENILAGVSSYVIGKDALEVQILTKQEYRHKNLATILGAKMIEWCKERELYPNWNAENLISVKLAEKLGY